MWEVIRFIVLGGALTVMAAVVVLGKDRSEEPDTVLVARLATQLSETLQRRAPLSPFGQIMLCRQLLCERVEEGADKTRYSHILMEALRRNWPHVPQEYFAATFQKI